jgi:hypothetical protein
MSVFTLAFGVAFGIHLAELLGIVSNKCEKWIKNRLRLESDIYDLKQLSLAIPDGSLRTEVQRFLKRMPRKGDMISRARDRINQIIKGDTDVIKGRASGQV